MASFSEHINQAKRNLAFLDKTHNNIADSWDWQVTVSFYVAVHLANAHIANKINEHYRSHGQVDNALNPEIAISPTKFSEDNYLAYRKLQGLARRSRYLCNDNISDHSTSVYFTYDKHFIKAIKNLNKLLKYFSTTYSISFDSIKINCVELQNNELEYFKYAGS
ncbi:MAG TPA: hypothetical protein VD908_03560 [Cytophagales bacterium]|nr:hypothetical protein [Cytophagales bacterium]